MFIPIKIWSYDAEEEALGVICEKRVDNGHVLLAMSFALLVVNHLGYDRF